MLSSTNNTAVIEWLGREKCLKTSWNWTSLHAQWAETERNRESSTTEAQYHQATTERTCVNLGLTHQALGKSPFLVLRRQIRAMSKHAQRRVTATADNDLLSANTWKGRPSLDRRLRDTRTKQSRRSTLLLAFYATYDAGDEVVVKKTPWTREEKQFFLIMTIAHSY